MNNIETLEALVEAGENATEGEWGSPFKDKVRAGDMYESVVCALTPYMRAQNADFITQSANARPALKQLLSEHKAQREALVMAKTKLRELCEWEQEDHNADIINEALVAIEALTEDKA